MRAFADLHGRWLERTKAWWERARADGQIDPRLEHNAVATFTIGALRGVALEWLLAPESVDVAAAYAYLLRSLRAGLADPS